MRTMLENTRLSARKVPSQFGFIQIFGDEGGRILDFSESGLAFESFSPLGPAKTLQFWFSLNLRDRVEATGEVVWLDPTTRVGGLRFMNLTDRAIKHIRAQYNDSFGGDGNHKGKRFLAALSRQHSLSTTETKAGENAGTLPQNRIQRTPTSIGVSLMRGDTSDAAPSAQLNSTDLISLQRHIAACRRQFILGTLLGLLVASSAAVVTFRFWSPARSPVSSPLNSSSDSQTSLGSGSSGPYASQPAASPNLFGASGNSQPAAINGKYSTGSASRSSKNVRSTASIPVSNATPAVAASHADAMPRFSGKNIEKKTTSPERLWAAVQVGDSTAAVALADRYLSGDGVPENCLQARVLLLVASEKKNAEAIRKLNELDKVGCPSSEPK